MSASADECKVCASARWVRVQVSVSAHECKLHNTAFTCMVIHENIYHTCGIHTGPMPVPAQRWVAYSNIHTHTYTVICHIECCAYHAYHSSFKKIQTLPYWFPPANVDKPRNEEQKEIITFLNHVMLENIETNYYSSKWNSWIYIYAWYCWLFSVTKNVWRILFWTWQHRDYIQCIWMFSKNWHHLYLVLDSSIA